MYKILIVILFKFISKSYTEKTFSIDLFVDDQKTKFSS